VIDSFVNKCRDRLVLKDIETWLMCVQNKSFDTDTSIATEEIFDVATETPGVITANVTVVGAEHWTAFTGALYDVDQRGIRSELGVGERIRARRGSNSIRGRRTIADRAGHKRPASFLFLNPLPDRA
jgi:hypothetical protein